VIIGSTALGAVWGCIAIAAVGAFSIFRARSGEDWGTAFGVMYSGFCCGMPLGAIAGLAVAARIAQEETRDWSPIVWIGVTLGVALGPIMSYQLGVHAIQFYSMNALIVALVAAALGTVGGMLAAAGEGMWRLASAGRSRFVATLLGLFFVMLTAISLLAAATPLLGKQLTATQLAWSLLIAVPILFGLLTWQKGGRSRSGKKGVQRRSRSRG
jgi:hypothetical protein